MLFPVCVSWDTFQRVIVKTITPVGRRHRMAGIRTLCSNMRKIVFSGIQPSGTLHIGNYLGMVQGLVKLQHDHDVIISVVDLHAMTTYKDPSVLRKRIVEMAASLMASGVDVRATVLFQQSSVPLHTQLAWLLGTFVTVPQLSHLSHFREKTEVYRNGETADILLYRAAEVPVGEDQVQHIRLAQKIAGSFNNKYKQNFFPVPVQINSTYGRVKSLRDPTKKMSKSDPDIKSCINIDDSSDTIKLKVQKAVTDCISDLSYDPHARPGVSNLLRIHSGLTNTSVDQIVKENGGKTVGQYKMVLAEVIAETLKPVRDRIRRLTKDEGFVTSALAVGSDRASEIAFETYDEVKKLVGIQL
ncbi:unnamed protein product [Soboliphyme baturini]|uniref:tryptophan--tRNA ligase n=1 Tax=Soboliphyme baturini TaxID=241478 RepID=A0A183IFR3_9BILA|nr:unnamed protein product [Soboliphyme baturini]